MDTDTKENDGKFGQWGGWFAMLKWFFAKRIWCKHANAKFVKKVGWNSKFYCSDCDDHYYIRNTWE